MRPLVKIETIVTRKKGTARWVSRDLPREQAVRVVEMVRSLLREKRYRSNAELGRALGVRGQAISQWFSGKNSPSYRVAMKVADLAGVSVQELLGPPLPEPRPASSERPSKR